MSSQPTKHHRNTQKIAIIAAEIGWGSGFAAAERGPELLLGAGLADRLDATVTRIAAVPSMAEGELSPSEIEKVIMKHTLRVSEAVLGALQNGMFPVVIGGDHTSALGFHTGLARAHGETGIVWVDAHTDLNTPESSPSGNLHGMVMAGLLGRGSELMLATTATCQTRPKHVAMVGVRDIDPGEQMWLDEGTINCMTMDEVRERGLATCMRGAVDTANQAEAGFGLTIDIDVIDPCEAPFVATPVNGGLSVEECAKALSDLPHKDRLLGMEVVEFTPRDSEPNDVQNACELMVSFIKAVTGVAVKPTI